ncbi:hypothetical protein GCM10023067_55430 [Aminobacter aganoensis]
MYFDTGAIRHPSGRFAPAAGLSLPRPTGGGGPFRQIREKKVREMNEPREPLSMERSWFGA